MITPNGQTTKPAVQTAGLTWLDTDHILYRLDVERGAVVLRQVAGVNMHPLVELGMPLLAPLLEIHCLGPT